jgi:hypothetical protein
MSFARRETKQPGFSWREQQMVIGEILSQRKMFLLIRNEEVVQ